MFEQGRLTAEHAVDHGALGVVRLVAVEGGDDQVDGEARRRLADTLEAQILLARVRAVAAEVRLGDGRAEEAELGDAGRGLGEAARRRGACCDGCEHGGG
tara:strand:+ start:283 stop:582 length:300 start_codon:yes stop_codon:yes gene_type:complete